MSVNPTNQEPLIEITVIPVTPLRQNCQVYANKQTGECFVVDPGGDAHLIKEFLDQNKLRCVKILLTHGHFDHIGGVTSLRNLLGYPVAVIGPCQQDEIFFDRVMLSVSNYQLPQSDFADFTMDRSLGDSLVTDGQELTLLGINFVARHTPGHSPGHVVYIAHQLKHVIAGDLVFRESVGRTDLLGSSFADLEKSVKTVIFSLDDAYTLIPGHGVDTTVGHERKYNPYVRP